MTEDLANKLAEFIKDHDKRFEAKARPDGTASTVLLTLASDGTTLEPIADVAGYEEEQIKQNDPGPTVKAAWDNWKPQHSGNEFSKISHDEN